jgi:hypothetical protein
MLKRMNRRRPFTLLEVMVALTLLLIVGGIVGIKMHEAIGLKRFQSDLDRLRSRLFVCQKLSVATQADWEAVLKEEGGQWFFEARCVDGLKTKRLAPLKLHSLHTTFNGKPIRGIEIDFYSSGQILPEGVLQFCRDPKNLKKGSQEWKVPEIFQREDSTLKKKLGPIHPLNP